MLYLISLILSILVYSTARISVMIVEDNVIIDLIVKAIKLKMNIIVRI